MGGGEIGAGKAVGVHLLCCLSLGVGDWLARLLYSWSLVTHTSETLRVLLIIHGPIVIVLYSLVRRYREHCSFVRTVGRGLLAVPADLSDFLPILSIYAVLISRCSGALVNAFGAIVLGAPIGTRYWASTMYWSLLMSLLTFVPSACVFGSSSRDWQRLLAHLIPEGRLDSLVSLPAYGSIIGAWVGAWPMPLDWERPWQEWPICVTYGSVGGYMMGALASIVFILIHRPIHIKGD